MAQLKGKDLLVANTSNVKEMKNGRPMNVKAPDADLPNCTIVKLGAAGEGVEDHVYTVTVVEDSIAAADLTAGLIYVMVAPEIMVEEARRTDGHIGLFRFEEGQVYTAYQLSAYDRLELSANHPQVGLGTKIGERTMAEAMYLLAAGDQQAAIVMHKIEFLPVVESDNETDETDGE